MKTTLHVSQRASYPDYLCHEAGSNFRHEFIDGIIVAMAGGSDEHNMITGAFGAALKLRLPRGCRYASPDQRFWIAATTRARYSDGSVICGPPEHPPHDPQATTNPTIIIEVLSPSSAGDDDGDKRQDFQTLSSLQAYVLAAQDDRWIKVYRRTEVGWTIVVYRDGESFDLPPGLTRAISVAEIYDDILDAKGHSLVKAP